MLTLEDLVLGSVGFCRTLPLPDPMSLGNKPPVLSRPGPWAPRHLQIMFQQTVDFISSFLPGLQVLKEQVLAQLPRASNLLVPLVKLHCLLAAEPRAPGLALSSHPIALGAKGSLLQTGVALHFEGVVGHVPTVPDVPPVRPSSMLLTPRPQHGSAHATLCKLQL